VIGTACPVRISIIGICDPHFSAHNPSAWKVDYLEETLKTLEQVFLYAQKEHVDAIVWAGDIFHLKSPTRNPLWFVTSLIKILRKAGCPHYTIAGNHDLKWGSLEGLEGQPLELLIESGAMSLLDTESVLFSNQETSLEIAGKSYEHGNAVEPVFSSQAQWKLAVGHYWFGKNTGTMFGEPVFGPEYLEKWAANVFLIGHHHEDQGIVEKTGKYYCSQGSMSRTGAHKQDLTRKPAAVWMTFTKASFEGKVLRPKVRAMEQLIDIRQREQIKKEEEEIEKFIETLKDNEMMGLDPKKILEEMNLDKEIKERVQRYLEEAETR